MRLIICNDWFSDKNAHFLNKDGFLRALGVFRDEYKWETTFLKRGDPGIFKHEYVTFEYVDNIKEEILKRKPDAILIFSDTSRPLLAELEGCGIPLALAFTGGLFQEYVSVPDIIFTESRSYVDWLKANGAKKVVQAFGTNTDIFKPIPQPKIWDAFFPATFTAWKRHDLFAEATGANGLVAGWPQPHEPQCVQACLDAGCAVLHHQNAESIAYLYNQSKTCVVTSADNGGSQRTVLEALASNIPTIVMKDSDKCSQYIEECGVGAIVEPDANRIREAIEEWKDKEVNTRDFILKNYSHDIYAQKMKEGIESIM